MKRIFVFSYHGKGSHQTGFNRISSIARTLSKSYEVHFVYGNESIYAKPINVSGNLIEIPLSYNTGILCKIYKSLRNSGKNFIAKSLLVSYYFITGKEIFDLRTEFDKYRKQTNIRLSKDDVVFVSYPSISIHNLGYNLKKEFGCKLVLDYRDPGVFGYQLIEENKIFSLLRSIFLKGKELRNLQAADLIVTISETLKSMFYEQFRNDILVVRNGFDIAKINFNLISDSITTFNLVYLGSIYTDQLEDLTFFKAVRKFIDDNSIQPQKFQIKFVGTGDNAALKSVIRHFNLSPYTRIGCKMPISQIYTELYDASMFFHLKYGDRTGIITTKQYDYLAFQKPILLPVNDGGDLQEHIKKYNAGFICEDLACIVKTLKTTYDKHFTGNAIRIERTQSELHELSREYQEEILAQHMDKL